MPILLLAWGYARSIFGAVLTFCSKPPGSWIAAAVGLALGLWWFGQHEFNNGKLACESAHADAVAALNAQQTEAIIDADQKSQTRTTASDKHTTEVQRVIVHVKDEAAALPTASNECVPASIADELRGIH